MSSPDILVIQNSVKLRYTLPKLWICGSTQTAVRDWAEYYGLSKMDYYAVGNQTLHAFIGHSVDPQNVVVLEGFEPTPEMASSALIAGVNFAKIPVTKRGPRVISSENAKT